MNFFERFLRHPFFLGGSRLGPGQHFSTPSMMHNVHRVVLWVQFSRETRVSKVGSWITHLLPVYIAARIHDRWQSRIRREVSRLKQVVCFVFSQYALGQPKVVVYDNKCRARSPGYVIELPKGAGSAAYEERYCASTHLGAIRSLNSKLPDWTRCS